MQIFWYFDNGTLNEIFFVKAAYKRLAPENEVIKSLDDNENNSTTSESMGSPSELWFKKTEASSVTLKITSLSLVASVTNSTQTLNQTHSTISLQASITSSNVGMDSGDLSSDNNNSGSEISDISNTLMSEQSTPTCDLASFLIQRACRNPTLANYLYWYLCIECESQETVRKQDEQVKNMYGKVLKTFKRTLMLGERFCFIVD